MAHFRGVVRGKCDKEASQCGTEKTGLTVEAQSWQGKVVVELRVGREERDHARISLQPHNGSGKDVLLFDDAISGEATAWSETERLCLDFLTQVKKPVAEGENYVCRVNKELYHQLRRFMLSRSVGHQFEEERS